MKRTSFLLLLIFIIVTLSGCGISQKEYAAVVENNLSLQAQVKSLSSEKEELKSEKQALESEKETLKSEKQSIQKEYLDYKHEQVLAEMDKGYGIAWATTSFGDDTICLISDDGSHFQCLASNTYKISDAGISTLWSDFKNSVITLTIISENIKYETISVKFYDPSGTYFLEYTLKKENSSYILDTINCNIFYADKIIPSIIKLSAK